MFLKSLQISQLRNITHADLSFDTTINLVVGDNGAGKTSLLEAIYLLGRAKSFRTGHIKSPVQMGKEHLSLFGQVEDESLLPIRLGLKRSGRETQVKINGETASKLSTLATTLPLALVTPLSHRLLDEGPDHRRRILNWGVFHVEHFYKTAVGNYARTLVQRNNALRSKSPDLTVWNKALAEHATIVSELQTGYFEKWIHELMTLSKRIQFLKSLQINFNRGWKQGEDLYYLLKEREAYDIERGFTSIGPQRADLVFKVDGVETRQVLSRGQQKVLIIITMLAQAAVLEKARGKKPIFLLDDLESELDKHSLNSVCTMLREQGSQVFITSLNPDQIISQDWAGEISMFHVEHGAFAERATLC